MEAVVLAGGLGTRLRDVLPGVPKPMAPIGNRPFLALLLERLSQRGFRRVVLSVGYLADAITSYFGNEFCGMAVIYHVETKPLGTGGALAAAFGRVETDHAFVFNGDTFLDLEIEAVEACYLRRGRPIIVVRQVASTARYGRVELVDGQVRSLERTEDPSPGLINAGCYVLRRDTFETLGLGPEFSMEVDFLPPAITREPYDAFVSDGFFIDIGIPEDYRRAIVELPRVLARK